MDILLLITHEKIDDKQLLKAIQLTFETRGTHPIPESLPDLPPILARDYRRITQELGFSEIDFDSAQQQVKGFLAPALAKSTAE